MFMNENKRKKPLVSVVMCVYNTPKDYLLDAVKSILKQTYSNFEFIIVDDCSSIDLFEDNIFKDERIILLKNDSNLGLSKSRNRGICISKGKYIAIMDSDDISLPTRIEKQVEYMENNPDVVVCGTWFMFFGIKNHEVKIDIDDNEYYRCCLIFGNSPTLRNPSTMIRKQVLVENNIKCDERFKLYSEDYKLWIQLSALGKITNYKEVLLYYRTHENQATHKNDVDRKSAVHDNIVKKEEILDKLHLELSNYEEDLFCNFTYAKHYNPVKYIAILNRLLEANKTSRVYKQDRLEKRVREQWISAIQHVNNPVKLTGLFINQKGHRKELLKIKLKQLLLKK